MDIVSPHLLALREALKSTPEPLVQFAIGELKVEIVATADSLFAIVRRKGAGGVAIRAVYLVGPFDCRLLANKDGEAALVEIRCPLGTYKVAFSTGDEALARLRITVHLQPTTDCVLPFIPRDLYALGPGGDPLRATGKIEAKQRGLNSGVLYFRIEEPAFGNVLYFQNLTALNDYFRTTGTKPKKVVGGHWPEMGMLLPTQQSDDDPLPVLTAGSNVTLSDAILVFRPEAPPHERESARQFIQMLGAAYTLLEKPPVAYRDWAGRAELTARDLSSAPEATIRHYGHTYVHPYTAAEYPDIMVQMSVITALHDWGKWRGEPHSLEAELKKGLRRFFDPKLKTLRRYLPNVGPEKNADAVDSWYLYHPMINLGILALDGDDDARKLFLDSIDFGIKAAQHFAYEWSVQYNISDFSVIEETAPADGRGQTDVGGVYAWVMLQAFELTDDKRFLDEARNAIDTAMGLRFDINYQANLTAWGAAACMRLWRITNASVYREQSYVYLASFLHNAVIWESDIGHAERYETFLAVTCLQDAPYMAMYECFDSFVAFERFLGDAGPDLEPEALMFVTEYCKYALSRAWCYYPDALPPEAIAEKQREANGHVDPDLSFPLEDLYPDGQQAGQVGQEVYGAGAAFIFASRSTHDLEGAPFRLYCDYLLRSVERTGERAMTLALHGGEGCYANVRLLRRKGMKLPTVRLLSEGAEEVLPTGGHTDRIDFEVPANGRLILAWE